MGWGGGLRMSTRNNVCAEEGEEEEKKEMKH